MHLVSAHLALIILREVLMLPKLGLKNTQPLKDVVGHRHAKYYGPLSKMTHQ